MAYTSYLTSLWSQIKCMENYRSDAQRCPLIIMLFFLLLLNWRLAITPTFHAWSWKDNYWYYLGMFHVKYKSNCYTITITHHLQDQPFYPVNLGKIYKGCSTWVGQCPRFSGGLIREWLSACLCLKLRKLR
jgi:hypothetical protein